MSNQDSRDRTSPAEEFGTCRNMRIELQRQVSDVEFGKLGPRTFSGGLNMSTPEEAERLAKAARAKALLKKHQKKKAGPAAPGRAPTPLSSVVSQSPPGSSFSPAPSEAGDASEFGELSVVRQPSTPRTGQAPLGSSTASIEPASPPLQPNTEPRAQLENHQQTISLLVAEKASLSASLKKEEERASKEHRAQLQAEQDESQSLRETIALLSDELRTAVAAKSAASAREEEHTIKSREMERDLTFLRTSLSESTLHAKELEAQLRELQEEVQANGQVEALEKTLRSNQERAESLEFQLSKSKQAHAKLKEESSGFEGRLKAIAASESEWRSRHTSLSEELIASKASVSSLADENDTLKAKFDRALVDAGTARKERTEIESLQAAMSAELASVRQQLLNAQAEAVSAERRATDAERAHQELQSENVQLMASLNEIRPKVIGLTQDKVTLSEERERMQHGIRGRDATIAQLEATVAELGASLEESKHSALASDKRWTAEKEALEGNVRSLERSLVEAEEQLHDARQSVQELAAGRTAHRKAVTQYEDSVGRLKEEVERYRNSIASLEQSLHESNRAAAEAQELLSQTRSEIESLRVEGSQKDEEIIRLKDQTLDVNIQPPSPRPEIPTVENDLLDAQRHQHALELSAARSQIRSLENALYLEQTKTHNLQRQMGELNAIPVTSTPQILPRPLSSASVASSNAFTRSPIPRPLNGLDSTLSAEIRHKRKISLSMLKARIDSERDAHAVRPAVQALPGLTATKEEGSSPPIPSLFQHPPEHYPTHAHAPHSQYFRDESHIFWCHACSGDLVVL